MLKSTLFLIISICVCIGVVVLQINLSKMKNKWFGLILPVGCFLLSILIVSGIYTFSIFTATSTGAISNNAVEEIHVEEEVMSGNLGETLATIIPVFIISNIPTIILMCIYFACREKYKRKNQLDKMRIDDLE